MNGCFRGKRIPVSSLKKLEKGCYFPASVFAMDILGNVVEEAGLGQEMGEPDRTCVPVLGSLTPSAADPEFIGQMLLTMVDEDGAPFDVGEILKQMGLSSTAHLHPLEISTGQKRRLSVATALGGLPKVLLLDEPTFGLDQKHAFSMLELFHHLVADGVTIIMITHDEKIAKQATRIVRILDGNIVEEVSMDV